MGSAVLPGEKAQSASSSKTGSELHEPALLPKAIVDGLPPSRKMSLDQAIEYLHNDELLEVTPESLRIRKKQLVHHMRQKEAKKAKA